ncbi:hypothetical protein VKT23_015818 [Stygiomarasmius scandens]|uniref:Uncharacterized protein n=1 Tax=Marasmiellus scandens TaxID=2682957 RepID=A0ABR1IWV6_9AGAR
MSFPGSVLRLGYLFIHSFSFLLPLFHLCALLGLPIHSFLPLPLFYLCALLGLPMWSLSSAHLIHFLIFLVFQDIAFATRNVTVDHDNSSISYSRNWWRESFSNGVADHWSDESDAVVTFTFTGVAIFYSVHLYPSYWTAGARFNLDGNSADTAQLYDPTADDNAAERTVVWSKTGLENGIHTLKVQKAPGDDYVILDRLIFTQLDEPSPNSTSQSSSNLNTVTMTVTTSVTKDSPLPSTSPTSLSTSSSSPSPLPSSSISSVSTSPSSSAVHTKTPISALATQPSTSSTFAISSSDSVSTSASDSLSSDHTNKNLVIILVPVLGGTVLLAVLCIILFRIIKKRKRRIMVTPYSDSRSALISESHSSLPSSARLQEPSESDYIVQPIPVSGSLPNYDQLVTRDSDYSFTGGDVMTTFNAVDANGRSSYRFLPEPQMAPTGPLPKIPPEQQLSSVTQQSVYGPAAQLRSDGWRNGNGAQPALDMVLKPVRRTEGS